MRLNAVSSLGVSARCLGIGGRESCLESFSVTIPASRRQQNRSPLTAWRQADAGWWSMMAAQQCHVTSSAALLFTSILCLLCLNAANAFLVEPTVRIRAITPQHYPSSALFAKKKSRRTGAKEAKTFGFGGKATEPCPCGSGLGYMKCCGKLHKDAQAYADATAEQVVRARYSAYAKREVSKERMKQTKQRE